MSTQDEDYKHINHITSTEGASHSQYPVVNNKFVGEIVTTKGVKSLMEACKIDDYMGVE